MAQNGDAPPPVDEATQELEQSDNPQLLGSEMAKAFQELAQGEKTASALESRLTDIEARIEQLLASVEQQAPKQSASKGKEAKEVKSSESSSQ